jgi:hypothetical protein
MNQYAEILRNTAEEIRAQDILGWGNACSFGADEIDRLETVLVGLTRIDVSTFIGKDDLAAIVMRIAREAVRSTIDATGKPD